MQRKMFYLAQTEYGMQQWLVRDANGYFAVVIYTDEPAARTYATATGATIHSLMLGVNN